MPSSPDNHDAQIIQAGYRYALSLSQHEHDAEDLVQQACLRVYRSRGKLVGRPYIFAAIRNLFVDQQRRQKTLSFERMTEPEKVVCIAGDQQRIEDRDDLESILSRLSPAEREVLYLNCVEQFTAKEISALTGSPRGTVLSLLSRAKEKLSPKQPTGLAPSESHE